MHAPATTPPARPLQHSRGRQPSPLSGAFPRRPGPRASSLLPGVRNGPQRPHGPERTQSPHPGAEQPMRVGNPAGPAARLVLPPHPLRRDSMTGAAIGSPVRSPERAHTPRLYYFHNLPKHLSWPCPEADAQRQGGSQIGGGRTPEGQSEGQSMSGAGRQRTAPLGMGCCEGGVEGQRSGLVGDAQEAQGRPRGGPGASTGRPGLT